MAEYCLRWNNHQPNLVTVFSELLNTEALVDVTLATDGQFIHAHKLVLSACSAYFKELFGSNPCKHPIVFLKDIRFEDLRTVVDFIYKGEVNVTHERLQDVLRTAESLKIKGLADRPLSFEEHSSQTRGHPLSSAFSSQRSSLNDSREQLHSLDADDAVDSRTTSSPPAYKKRKIASQESAESGQGNNREDDKTPPVNSEKEEESGSNPPSEMLEEGNLNSEMKKIKKEEDSSEVIPEYQESRAADAMLLLQGSSSETEGGTGASANTSSNSIRGDAASNILGSHSQVGQLSPCNTLNGSLSTLLSNNTRRNKAKKVMATSSPKMYPQLTASNGAVVTIRHGTPENFLQAIEEIHKEAMGFCKAGRLFGVNNVTLLKYYRAMGYNVRKRNNPKYGGKVLKGQNSKTVKEKQLSDSDDVVEGEAAYHPLEILDTSLKTNNDLLDDNEDEEQHQEEEEAGGGTGEAEIGVNVPPYHHPPMVKIEMDPSETPHYFNNPLA